MTKIRTMVVDDEPMARERIVGLLSQEKDIEVVGEYADGTQAVSAIQQQHPDLVFLDVQMPACDGFGVIEQLGPDQVPAVVFVTAYDEYALKAFEVHAIDYLLKPFGRDRFAQTLQHAREHLERRRAGDLGKRLMALVQDIKPEPQRLDRLVVKSGGRVFFLRTARDRLDRGGRQLRAAAPRRGVASLPRDDEQHGRRGSTASASSASTARASSTPTASRKCSRGSTANMWWCCRTERGSH